MAKRHSVPQAWADGGYSDDLIVAAKCGEAGLAILCPSSSVFRQSLVRCVDFLLPIPHR